MKLFGEKDTNSIRSRGILILKGIALLLTVSLLISGGFFLLDKFDNKYSHPCPQPQKGILTMDDQTFADGRFSCLIDNWQYTGESGTRYLFIGQFSDYSLRIPGANRFGTAVYSIKLQNLGREQTLSLQLPELFSACRIRVGGRELSALGSTDPKEYRPRIKNQIISFSVPPSRELGMTEIEITVVNYDHYYSGMFYPPLLGSTQTITGITAQQLIFYGILCFASLAIGLFSLVVWNRRSNNRIYLLYGIMVVAFGLHVAYPFVRWLGLPGMNLFYALEDCTEYIMIAAAVMICVLLAGQRNKNYVRWLVLPVCAAMCVITFLGPLAILPAQPELIRSYGRCIDMFQLLVSGFLLVMSFSALFKKTKGAWPMLCGNVLFAAGMLWDTVSANTFEPIRGGWPKEYTGFCTVIVFSLLVQRYIGEILRENSRLTESLEQEVELRTKELAMLLEDRKKLLAETAHDLKAPVASILTFIDYMKLSNVGIDEETGAYLKVIEKKSEEMKDRVTSLQNLSSEYELTFDPARICLNDFLKDFYNVNQPDAQAYGIHFKIKLPSRRVYMDMDAGKMTRALENLLFNAFEFTPVGGSVLLSLKADVSLRLVMKDTGRGIAAEDLDLVFQENFSKREEKDSPGKGLGLSITKNIVEKHGGKICVQSRLGKGTKMIMLFNAPQRLKP